MVRKLIKHEFISYIRSLLPIELVLVGVAMMLRFVQLFENDSVGYKILFGSSVFVYVVAILVSIVMTFIVSIQRYYKNLFKAEGYLTFTLPVSEHQIILTKLLCAVSVTLITLFNVFVSVCIATAGDVCIELFKAAAYIFNKYFVLFGVHGALYIIETLLIFLISLACEYLLFYACITVGQMARRNRVLAAIGIYFAYYYIVEMLYTAVMVLLTLSYLNPFMQEITIAFGEFYMAHPFATTHIILIGSLLVYALVGVAYYLVTYKVMRKKLNLE